MRIQVRKATESDHAFIYATYLRSNWFSPKNDTVLKKDTWMRVQHGRLEGVLATEPVRVVCLEEDPDVILGYKVQDFCYVRPQWRKVAGIEDMLK